MSFQLYSPKIAIIGLGYVGLPLATVFGKLHNVVGFDIDASRISELKEEQDRTGEVSSEDFKTSKHLQFTSLIGDIKHCNIFIITVPTPIDENKKPRPVTSYFSIIYGRRYFKTW